MSPSPSSRVPAFAQDALLVLLALTPIYAIYAVHFARGNGTGFIQYDMPTYPANGREVFERGDGLLHANPYDADPDAPRIYFHWLTFGLGLGVSQLGLDPGWLFCAVGVIAGAIGGWLTLQIVKHLVPQDEDRPALFLLTMWGGGLLVLGKLVVNLLTGEPAFAQLLEFDPARGWWFLSWGRNFLFPTEAVYHVLVAAAWLCILRRHEWWAAGFVTLLAATHPFSGLQHLLILGAWNLVQLVQGRQLVALWRCLAISAVLAAFLSYYFIFLEMWPAHAALRHTWSLAWILPIPTILLAYGPVATAAGLQLRSTAREFQPKTWFFVVAFVVSFLLAKHEWFIAPRQPLHFTRGYVWLPLMCLALPQIADWLQYTKKHWPETIRAVVLSVGALLAVSDNLVFYSVTLVRGEGRQLSPAAREMFAWMDAHELDGVLLAPDAELSYLSATYTSVRPYYGHLFNTPDYQHRHDQVQVWSRDGTSGAWLATTDYLLLSRKESAQGFQPAQWQAIHENESYVLYARRPPSNAP